MKNLVLPILLVLSIVSFAQDKKESILEKRANDVVKILNEPSGFESVFSKSFLTQVPPTQLQGLAKKFRADYGKALKVEKIDKKDDYNALIVVSFEKGFLAKMNLILEQAGSNLINGLVVASIDKDVDSLGSIVDDLKKLSGKTSFAVAKLNGKNFQTLISHNPDEHFAIGSTFKLYILSELVRQVSEGKRKWSDVVDLKHFSLPSGQLQNFERGSPFTLHTLASMMIFLSDNTATDQLLLTLGRENVENILKVTGNSKPELTKPFLTTAEMFKLKGVEELKLAKTYVSADLPGKREILSKEIAKYKTSDIKLEGFLVKPTYISQIEWFASSNDLIRLMNWLRLNTENEPTKKARGVMTINKALSADVSKEWKYVGYKGGSEPGVISMTFLLQSKKDEWFVLTSSWNNEKVAVDEQSFISTIQTAVKILQEQTK